MDQIAQATLDSLSLIYSALPDKSGPALFLHAPRQLTAYPALAPLKDSASLECYFAADAAAFSILDKNVSRETLGAKPLEAPYKIIFVRSVQNRVEMRGLLARALGCCAPDGVVLVAQANSGGAGALEKDIRLVFSDYDVAIKYKCRGFTLSPAHVKAPDILDQWAAAAALQIIPETGMWSQAGLFGWQKIDEGSALLAAYINGLAASPLKGLGADFGCGNGYLTGAALSAGHQIEHMSLIDHDRRALEAARKNLSDPKGMFHVKHFQAKDSALPEIDYLWADLAAPVSFTQKFDFIIMNPPFHAGQKGRPDLGISFIEGAAKSLKKGGKLYMVANRHLPYEASLEAHFRKVTPGPGSKGFKIIEGLK